MSGEPAIHCWYCGWVNTASDHLSTCRENELALSAAPTTVDPDRLVAEFNRLVDGLRRLRDQDYDSGYTPETYADAVLTGHEPPRRS